MTCAAVEPIVTRVLRLVGIALLTACSAMLVAFTRLVIEAPTVLTFLRLGTFVVTLGMLASSVAAFWWRDGSLRRVEWAAYLGIAMLLSEQFATGLKGGPSSLVALTFGLFVGAVVLARLSRHRETPMCNCG